MVRAFINYFFIVQKKHSTVHTYFGLIVRHLLVHILANETEGKNITGKGKIYLKSRSKKKRKKYDNGHLWYRNLISKILT